MELQSVTIKELEKARAYAFNQCETVEESRYILGDESTLLIDESLEDDYILI